ncbi:hypothetical protein [Parasitella parasitica]|uniref:BHLH domain-containing protein n=1 Tax=Parasitella parasitica TaxID=35722 RepID=A0A0B7NRP9_9FUNG|nr:hypothetical protein [Parasitella parasitica]
MDLENIFTEQEQGQLQSFLDNLDSVDANLRDKPTNITSNPSKQRRVDKKRTAPYHQKKAPSPSAEQLLSTSPSSPSTAAPAGRPKAGRVRKPAHELLSEDQKKANHIASEQKRRANIRIGFDQLVDMVPTLDNCHRSEALILQKSVDYIKDLVQDKTNLKQRVRELQTVLGDIPDEDSSDEEMDNSFY